MKHILKKSRVLKVELSPSEKNCVICLIEIPLETMKNAFYFILKAFFVFKILNFLSRLLGHVEKNGLMRNIRLT